jgi:hypothetical protein
MYQPTARSGPACLASLFVCSPVPITRPYHEKPSFDGYRSGLFESGRPPEPCCGVPEWTRRCAPRPRRCGIRGPAHSWSLSPRSARPRSASSPPWSSATSLISRPVRPCLGHPHPAHRPGHRHRAALPRRICRRRTGQGLVERLIQRRGQPRRSRHSSARDRPRRQHRSGRFAATEGSCGLA